MGGEQVEIGQLKESTKGTVLRLPPHIDYGAQILRLALCLEFILYSPTSILDFPQRPFETAPHYGQMIRFRYRVTTNVLFSRSGPVMV